MEFCHHFRCSLAEKQATGLHSTVVSIERVNSSMMFKAKKIIQRLYSNVSENPYSNLFENPKKIVPKKPK